MKPAVRNARRNRRRTLVSVPVFVTALLVAAGLAAIVSPSGSAFHRFEAEIQLTDNAASDTWPSFGSDGRIYFGSDRDGDSEVFVMDRDGSNIRQLTTNTGIHDGLPSYANGKIVFMSARPGEDSEIYIMDADGSNQRPLTDNDDSDSEPELCRDGSRIAFYSDRDGNQDIFTMDPDGSGLVKVTTSTYHDYSPAFSPDCSVIAYGSDPYSAIYTMNAADGSAKTQVTQQQLGVLDPAIDARPSFSWDGRLIVYDSFHTIPPPGPEPPSLPPPTRSHNGGNQIRVTNRAGTWGAELTTTFGGDAHPSFSPDGLYVAYMSSREAGGWDWEIYVGSFMSQAPAVLYDVDFGTPPHFVGSPPIEGAGFPPRRTVSDVPFGDPRVVTRFGPLADQPLRFDTSDGPMDQIYFRLDDLPHYPYYCAESDIVIAAMAPTDVFSVFLDVPEAMSVDFYPDGSLTAMSIRRDDVFSLGTPFRLRVVADVLGGFVKVSVDGVVLGTTPLGGSSTIYSVRFAAPGGGLLIAAIDDVLITSVNCEPASTIETPCALVYGLAVIPVGVGYFAWRWLRRRKEIGPPKAPISKDD